MKAYIYERNNPTLQLTAVCEVDSPTTTDFSKSASTLRQSIMTVTVNEEYDLNNILVNYPVIFELYGRPIVFGVIKNIKSEVHIAARKLELTVALGSDGFDEEVPTKTVWNGTTSTIFDTLITNYQKLYQDDVTDVVSFVAPPVDNGYVISPDGVLSYGQCIRQLLKQGYREQVTVTDSNIVITYVYDPEIFEINSEDTVKTTVTLAKDTYNKYIIYNELDLTDYKVAYLATDGTVSNSTVNLDRSSGIVSGSAIVTVDDFSQAYVNNILKQQAYSNSIELELIQDNYIYSFIFKSYIFNSLGSAIQFRYNGNLLNTYIDEIMVRGDLVRLKLGVSQTRLLDKLK